MSAPGPANVPDNDIFGGMFLYVLTLNTTEKNIVFHDDDDDDDGDKSVREKCSAYIKN